MSQENIEIVQRHVEAWNRRDLKAWLDMFHSGAEIDWSRSRAPHNRCDEVALVVKTPTP